MNNEDPFLVRNLLLEYFIKFLKVEAARGPIITGSGKTWIRPDCLSNNWVPITSGTSEDLATQWLERVYQRQYRIGVFIPSLLTFESFSATPPDIMWEDHGVAYAIARAMISTGSCSILFGDLLSEDHEQICRANQIPDAFIRVAERHGILIPPESITDGFLSDEIARKIMISCVGFSAETLALMHDCTTDYHSNLLSPSEAAFLILFGVWKRGPIEILIRCSQDVGFFLRGFREGSSERLEGIASQRDLEIVMRGFAIEKFIEEWTDGEAHANTRWTGENEAQVTFSDQIDGVVWHPETGIKTEKRFAPGVPTVCSVFTGSPLSKVPTPEELAPYLSSRPENTLVIVPAVSSPPAKSDPQRAQTAAALSASGAYVVELLEHTRDELEEFAVGKVFWARDLLSRVVGRRLG